MVYQVEIRRAGRIFVGKMNRSSVLQPDCRPLIFQTLHIQILSGIISEMCDTLPD